MKTILFTSLISFHALSVETYYGYTRNEEDCTIEINTLDVDDIRGYFAFKYHQQGFEASGIPGKWVNANTVKFKWGGTTAYLYLDDHKRAYQYDYTYDKAPNYLQITCYLP